MNRTVKRVTWSVAILAVVAYGATVGVRCYQWDQAEVVAFAFDTYGLRYKEPYIVPDEDAALIGGVHSLKWSLMKDTDLLAVADARGQDWLYLGDVGFNRTSGLSAEVHVSQWPHQVRGTARLVSLCGHSETLIIRKNWMYVLLGVAPKYRVIDHFGIVS